MKVLIACESSGRVRDAFIKKGHDAISCDLIPSEQPGPHVQGDVTVLLKEQWDLIVAHPPCTYLCRQAHRWIKVKKKQKEYELACRFFNAIKGNRCKRICIENPIPHATAKKVIGEYSQIIQPWQYGHDYSKKTCLWLKGLPKLQPTKIVKVTYYTTPKGRKYTRGWYFTPRNSIARSRTFPGIADAMANQWGRQYEAVLA